MTALRRSWQQLAGSTRIALTVFLGLVVTVTLWALAVDTDSDGMSDDYELFFGLNPTNAADASLNCDSDILTNLQEYSLWSDPFSTDTDCDGFPDGLDSNALSRAFIGWGDPLFTYTNEYRYTGPDWWLGAYKVGGQWTTNEPYAWHVAGGTSTASLRIDLCANDQMMRLRS